MLYHKLKARNDKQKQDVLEMKLSGLLLGRQYARAVVDALDPTGRLFGQRIIAQGLPGEALLDKSKRLMEGLEVPARWAYRLSLM